MWHNIDSLEIWSFLQYQGSQPKGASPLLFCNQFIFHRHLHNTPKTGQWVISISLLLEFPDGCGHCCAFSPSKCWCVSTYRGLKSSFLSQIECPNWQEVLISSGTAEWTEGLIKKVKKRNKNMGLVQCLLGRRGYAWTPCKRLKLDWNTKWWQSVLAQYHIFFSFLITFSFDKCCKWEATEEGEVWPISSASCRKCAMLNIT